MPGDYHQGFYRKDPLREKPANHVAPSRSALDKVSPQNAPFFALLIAGFVAMVLAGTVLLTLPISSSSGKFTSLINSLFTAASAVSDTGLVVVDTGAHWSRFGQTVILVLLQLGGLGIMVMSSFLLITLGHRVNLRDFRIKEALGASGRAAFFRLALQTLFITMLFESLGTFLLWRRFSEVSTLGEAWRLSIFHSISAFNNAGFEVLGEGVSLSTYGTDAYIILTLTGLGLLGSLSSPLLWELLTKIGWRGLSLDTRLALFTTLGLLVLGAAGILFIEYANDSTLGGMSLPQKLNNALFTSVMARTTGFSTLNTGDIRLQGLFLIMFLMFIGGVSGSTAGGVKVNTFSLIVLTATSYVRGQARVNALGRQIPEGLIHKAIAVAFLAGLMIVVVVLILSITEKAPFIQLAFEGFSAFGTVGLSTGVTPSLSAWGKLVLIFTMLVGRLGPLTMVLALTERQKAPQKSYPTEEVRIG